MLAPSPLLTITIEAAHDERSGDDLHLHVGGQGYWIARMASELGADVTLCATFGGETGAVAAALAGESSFAVHGVIASHNNGAYVQDRRSGERAELAATAGLDDAAAAGDAGMAMRSMTARLVKVAVVHLLLFTMPP